MNLHISTAKSTLIHYAKSVLIRSFSGPYFPTIGLKTEISKVNLRIQSECAKIRTRKTLNTDTFHTVIYYWEFHRYEK